MCPERSAALSLRPTPSHRSVNSAIQGGYCLIARRTVESESPESRGLRHKGTLQSEPDAA
jgi:hypothetical protein